VDLPPFDNSAMDGFALRAADLGEGATLRLVGEQFAGADFVRLDDDAGARQVLARGECIRITTGAPIPAGADTVV
jgi:molybdopterin molybdotransferase